MAVLPPRVCVCYFTMLCLRFCLCCVKPVTQTTVLRWDTAVWLTVWVCRVERKTLKWVLIQFLQVALLSIQLAKYVALVSYWPFWSLEQWQLVLVLLVQFNKLFCHNSSENTVIIQNNPVKTHSLRKTKLEGKDTTAYWQALAAVSYSYCS